MAGKKVVLVFFLVIGVALLTCGIAAAKANPPVNIEMGEISEVTIFDPYNLEGDGGVVNIVGTGFGDAYAPLVSLGEFGNLSVISYSDTEISAVLPAELVPGDYLLSITPHRSPEFDIKYPLTVGAETVPSGLVAFFPANECPPGWTEMTDAKGRVIVGLPLSGDVGGIVGSALTDMEERSHDHEFDLSAGTTGTGGAHNHTGLTSINEHTHSSDFFSASTDTDLVDYDDNYKISMAAPEHGHDIESSGAHGHQIQKSTGHTHSINPSSSTSTATYTGMPYLQLLVCEKY